MKKAKKNINKQNEQYSSVYSNSYKGKNLFIIDSYLNYVYFLKIF